MCWKKYSRIPSFPLVPEEAEGECQPLTEVTDSIRNDIYVEGLADVELRLAKCCCPRPGELPSWRWLPAGRGVSIHRTGLW